MVWTLTLLSFGNCNQSHSVRLSYFTHLIVATVEAVWYKIKEFKSTALISKQQWMFITNISDSRSPAFCVLPCPACKLASDWSWRCDEQWFVLNESCFLFFFIWFCPLKVQVTSASCSSQRGWEILTMRRRSGASCKACCRTINGWSDELRKSLKRTAENCMSLSIIVIARS